MEKQQIIGLAQQGDLEAIATLLNQSLAQYDTIAKVGQSMECLFVTLISNPVPDEETVIPIVLQEIEKWKTDNIKKLKVYGRTENQIAPTWEEEISLESLPLIVPTQISQEPPTILKKPPLETNNSETFIPSTNSKPAFNLRNLPIWGKGAIVALFASASAGSLSLLSNRLQSNTTAPSIPTIPVTTPSASPTPITTPTTKPTTETPKAKTTPTPTTTPKTTNTNSSVRKKQETTNPTTTKRRRRTETTTNQTQTEPTQKTQKRRRTQSTTNQTPTETKKTQSNNNSNRRSTQRTTNVPKKTTPKPTQRTTPTTPQVKPTPQSTSQPIYVPPPEKKTVETVPKSVDTPIRTNTNNNRRNTDITPPSAPANRRNTDVTPPSAPASKKEDAPTGDSP